MFYLKGCSKCRGDLSLDSDAYGAFLKCLQCGKLTEVKVAHDDRLRHKHRALAGTESQFEGLLFILHFIGSI